MSITENNTNFCRETRVIQTHRIFPYDLNSHGTLFGGKLMALIDDASSISAARHCRKPTMTAATDKLDFLHPLYENHSVCIETYVTGTGSRSIEVFAKVIGEDLNTGERYLAATCFMTFVVVEKSTGYHVPKIQPETPEEQLVCSNYEKRRQHRLTERAFNEEFARTISLSVPWMDSKN